MNARINTEVPYQRYRLTIEPTATLTLPAYSGSMLRGIFGHALLRHSCRCGTTQTHHVGCTYAHVFEGATQPKKPSGIQQPPRFVITPPAAKTYLPGKPVTFDFIIFGVSQIQLNEVKSAWQQACIRGIGTPPVRAKLMSFTALDTQAKPLNAQVTLIFKTPWLMKRHGRLLRPDQCTAGDFLWAINHRQQMLNTNFNLGLPALENHVLNTLASQLALKKDLQYVTWQRYSNRQTKQHPLSGILGKIHLSHPLDSGLSPLTALLGHGQNLHAGGKTSFGLGAYQIEVNK